MPLASPVKRIVLPAPTLNFCPSTTALTSSPASLPPSRFTPLSEALAIAVSKSIRSPGSMKIARPPVEMRQLLSWTPVTVNVAWSLPAW